MSASGEGRAWEAPAERGAAFWWAGEQPPHQQPRTPAALETVLLTVHPLPWRERPLDRQNHLRLTLGFETRRGRVGFSSLHFILAAHMSLTQEPRGRQRRTEVINLHL